MARVRRDEGTMDLLDWKPAEAGEPALRGPIDTVLPRLVSSALDGLDRTAIARRLSAQLNRRVSKATLDSWASPGKTAHHIHADALIMLMMVTGDHTALAMQCARLGYAPPVEAEYGDIVRDVVLVRRIEQKERELATMKAASLARLKGERP